MENSDPHESADARGVRLHVMEQRQKRLKIALMLQPDLAQAEPFENVDLFSKVRDEIIRPAMDAFIQSGSLKNHSHHIVIDNDHTDEPLALVGAGIRLVLSENVLLNGINLYEIPTFGFYHDRVKQSVQCRVEIYDSSRNGEDRLVRCPDIEAPLDFEAVTVEAIIGKLNSFVEVLARY
ncbi:hypothetical protein [Methylobacterium sp. Leaf85]|uniref:hypothetical protein n=1 Tax=Methylobacterium sp. Leaf85 TaxID=1736241 RepID=UPI0012E7DBF2|nr:hypothetical protein [Methylobacterium sp. Leaf85]